MSSLCDFREYIFIGVFTDWLKNQLWNLNFGNSIIKRLNIKAYPVTETDFLDSDKLPPVLVFLSQCNNRFFVRNVILVL